MESLRLRISLSLACICSSSLLVSRISSSLGLPQLLRPSLARNFAWKASRACISVQRRQQRWQTICSWQRKWVSVGRSQRESHSQLRPRWSRQRSISTSICLVSLCASQDYRQLIQQYRHSRVRWYFSLSPSRSCWEGELRVALGLGSTLKALTSVSHQLPSSSLMKSPTSSVRQIPRWNRMLSTISLSMGRVQARCFPVALLAIVNLLWFLLFWPLVTRKRWASGTESSQKELRLVMRKQWLLSPSLRTVLQTKACLPCALTYFWMTTTWSPSCCMLRLCRQRELTTRASLPCPFGWGLPTARFRTPTSSLGEQQLVTFPTKSLRETLLEWQSRPSGPEKSQSSGCSLRLTTKVSGTSSRGDCLDRASQLQKQAQGLGPASEYPH